VVCDLLTAAQLPPECRVLPFSMVSEPSILALQHYEEFIRQPTEATN
jgi:hypothetical protein